MDPFTPVTNFTPLNQKLLQEAELLAQPNKQKPHHIKITNALLVFSITLFVSSVGYWMQSSILQPPTKASQKIIEATPTLTPSPTPAEEEQTGVGTEEESPENPEEMEPPENSESTE